YFDHVAGLHWLRRTRRTRVNDVAGSQCHELTDIAHNIIDRENQLAGSAGLPHFSVHPAFDEKVAVVEAGHDARTQGAECIRALCTEPLEIIFLPVAFTHIVSSGDSENVFGRVGV